MHPVLLDAPVTLYSFGAFVALGIITGGLVLRAYVRQRGLHLEGLLDIFLATVVAGLFGARLWAIWFGPDELGRIWELLALSGGGLSLQGGVLFGGATLALLLRRTGRPLVPWLDAAALALLAGLAVGKWGSVLAGDTVGTRSELPWAVAYTDPNTPASALSGTLHPLAAYFAIGYALLLAGLIAALYRRERWLHYPGRVASVVLVGIGVLHAVLEFWHAPVDALLIGSWRLPMIFGAVLAVGGWLLWRISEPQRT